MRFCHLPLLFLALAAGCPPVCEGRAILDLFEFEPESASAPWRVRRHGANGEPKVSRAEVVDVPAEEAVRGVRIPVVEPGTGEVFRPVSEFGGRAGSLAVRLFVGPELPEKAAFKVFVRDWDFLWWQVRIEDFPNELGRGEVELSLPLRGSKAAATWRPVGHSRVWHQLAPNQVREFGVAVENESAGEPSSNAHGVYLLRATVRSNGARRARAGVKLSDVRWWPRAPTCLRPLEIRMGVQGAFENPFDADEVEVEAQIERPDGQTETVDGFYYADFSFRDPKAVEIRDLLRPRGGPDFRVRYTPRTPGRHQIRLTVRDQTGTTDAAEFAIEVGKAEEGTRGFVRVDPEDTRFLAYDSGEVFDGIGMNLRSPYDTRYRKNVPFTQWEDEGLHLYRRLLPKYSRNGLNVVEVWMSSWWLALEWIPDAVGNHGLGWMNQYRAWMLDRIVEWATENDIYIVLVFNNHGKFGEFYDTEWARNPYNEKNGGFLKNAGDFFSSERAFDTFERFARYTVARWGCYQNVLMWKLFTEIDLTGKNLEFYKKPQMAEWHRRACRTVKELDPYDHIITTHWMLSYQQINAPVASIPDLDVLTTDAYYLDRRNGVARCLSLIGDGTDFGQKFDKPLIVTEFGGSPQATSIGNLIKESHAGIWSGYFDNAAIAPFFWWFGLTEERDLYGGPRSLSRFMAGEDRRTFQPPEERRIGNFQVRILRNERRLLAWILDRRYYFSDRENREADPCEEVPFRYEGLREGKYRLQVWHTREGTLLAERPLDVDAGGSGRVTLPPFERDVALKIVPDSD